MPAAPIAREAIKWLAGVIAALLAERALDEWPDSIMRRDFPKELPPDLWRLIKGRYDSMCRCTDDPEAFEVCRDRMIAELEEATSGKRSKKR